MELAEQRPRQVHMATPTPGKCNAQRSNGELCKNGPAIPDKLGGNGRCKFHGGLATGPITQAGKDRVRQNGLKHGAYARALRESFATEEEKEVWDEIPQTTDLSAEIGLVRAQCLRFKRMLGRGELWVMTEGKAGSEGDKSKSWSEGAVSVEDLYERSLDLLRRMTHTQHDMRPGADIGGNLHVKITVSSGVASAETEVPVLTDEQEEERAPENHDPSPAQPPRQSDTGYEGDEPL